MSITKHVVPSSGMTHEEAVARARALAPAIRERAAQAPCSQHLKRMTLHEGGAGAFDSCTFAIIQND